MSRFRLSKEALVDIREISDYISEDNPGAAERLLDEFERVFGMLARAPGIGHTRKDLTRSHVLFWPVGSYLVIYHAALRPLHIVAVLHGKRNVKRALAERDVPRPAQ